MNYVSLRALTPRGRIAEEQAASYRDLFRAEAQKRYFSSGDREEWHRILLTYRGLGREEAVERLESLVEARNPLAYDLVRENVYAAGVAASNADYDRVSFGGKTLGMVARLSWPSAKGELVRELLVESGLHRMRLSTEEEEFYEATGERREWFDRIASYKTLGKEEAEALVRFMAAANDPHIAALVRENRMAALEVIKASVSIEDVFLFGSALEALARACWPVFRTSTGVELVGYGDVLRP